MTGAALNRRVFLIGFMGAGKTSVGQALAQSLRWPFYDLDKVIEERERKTVAAIFAAAGEDKFREMESAALREVLAKDAENMVVALGGGTFVDARNRIALQQAGAITVLLEAPLAELKRRCQADSVQRPLAQKDAAFEQLFASRRQAYALAEFRIATAGKTVAEVATQIEQLLGPTANQAQGRR